jgi:hypothetical protein
MAHLINWKEGFKRSRCFLADASLDLVLDKSIELPDDYQLMTSSHPLYLIINEEKSILQLWDVSNHARPKVSTIHLSEIRHPFSVVRIRKDPHAPILALQFTDGYVVALDYITGETKGIFLLPRFEAFYRLVRGYFIVFYVKDRALRRVLWKHNPEDNQYKELNDEVISTTTSCREQVFGLPIVDLPNNNAVIVIRYQSLRNNDDHRLAFLLNPTTGTLHTLWEVSYPSLASFQVCGSTLQFSLGNYPLSAISGQSGRFCYKLFDLLTGRLVKEVEMEADNGQHLSAWNRKYIYMSREIVSLSCPMLSISTIQLNARGLPNKFVPGAGTVPTTDDVLLYDFSIDKSRLTLVTKGANSRSLLIKLYKSQPLERGRIRVDR